MAYTLIYSLLVLSTYLLNREWEWKNYYLLIWREWWWWWSVKQIHDGIALSCHSFWMKMIMISASLLSIMNDDVNEDHDTSFIQATMILTNGCVNQTNRQILEDFFISHQILWLTASLINMCIYKKKRKKNSEVWMECITRRVRDRKRKIIMIHLWPPLNVNDLSRMEISY